MSDRFVKIAADLPNSVRQTLTSAAFALNDNDMKPLSLCRVYIPTFSSGEAWSFLLWLRRQH